MAKKSPRLTLVYCVGSLWAAVVLVVVFLIELRGPIIMGRFANEWFPYGAGIVGVVAGGGYYLMSRSLGVRPGGRFVAGIAVTGVVLFALSWGGQFLLATMNEGSPAGFVDWLRDRTEHSILTEGYGPQASHEAGKSGYLYLLLELAGFAGGLALPPLIQLESAFCPECRRYMKKQGSRYLEGEYLVEDVKRLPKASWKAVLQDELQHLSEKAARLTAALRTNQARETWAHLETLPAAFDTNRVAVWEFALAHCIHCGGRHATIRHHFLNLTSKLDNRRHGGKLEDRIYIPQATAGSALASTTRQPSDGEAK